MNNYAEFEEFRGRRFLFAAGRFGTFSGAERQAVYLARELIQNLNADVKFLGWGGDGHFADQIRAIGATPVVFPLNEKINRWSDRLRLLKLAAFVRRNLRPDYILPYVWLHCRPLGAIWRLTNARFCWWNQRDEGRGICGTRLEKWLMHSLPAIVSNSWEGRDFLTQKFGLAADRVKVINNGVVLPELGKDYQFRDQLGVPRSATLLAMVANLTRFKDHTTLLRAFAAALRLCSGTDLHLALLGRPGETTQELKSLAWDLGLHGRLHFAGTVLDVERALRSVDLVAHSSTLEGCPNGALEAMALGLPVIGTNISGMRQALGEDASETCLSPAGDWHSLAEQIACRVTDENLRGLEGSRNRQRIATSFSCVGMATETLRVIAKATG